MGEGPISKDRRRWPRVKVGGELIANVQTAWQAPVIDLSITGALIDVGEALHPGGRFTVRLPVGENRTLRLGARVVRSILVSLPRERDGRPSARYHAALEFIDVSAADAATLTAYVERLDGAIRAEISADPPSTS